jgi:hypothetical protein
VGAETIHYVAQILPHIDRIQQTAHDVEDAVVSPVRHLRPEQRPPDVVRAAIVALQNLRDKQSKALEAVSRTGSYRTPAIENSRRAAEDLLKKRIVVTRLYEECLRRGLDWNLEKNEYDLQQMLNLALEAEIQFQNSIRQIGPAAHQIHGAVTTIPAVPSTRNRWPV